MIVVAACFRLETAWIDKRPGLRVIRIRPGAPDGCERKLGRPDLLVSAGFCGGLDPHLRTGDLLLATEIVHRGGTIRIDPALVERARGALIREGMEPITGQVVAAARVIEREEEKRRLREETAAIGVEMEAGRLADWAQKTGTAFLAVKAVLDRAGEPLPLSRIADALSHPVCALRAGIGAIGAGRAIGRAIGAIIDEFGGNG